MDLAQRQPYHNVDFKSFAKTDPDFKNLWQSKSGKLDFQDPDTILKLSKAILRSDFGLELDVPNDRLCPPIPNRWNYVSWMQGLLDSTSPSYSNKYEPERKIVGLDIGTGASAIYTILCLRSRPSWTMSATDIDKCSVASAARNLALNSLLTRTTLLHTTSSQPLIPLQALGVERLDFTICNPPFFTDKCEMQNSLKGEGKSWKPSAICTGAEVEMVCPGGDLGFVTRIVEESLEMKELVGWYSSLFGKLGSAKIVIQLLKQHGISNWAVGVVDTGGSTKRWIVAWSFGDMRPRNSIARPLTIPNEYLPFPTSYPIPLPPDTTAQIAIDKVTTHFSSLDLVWTWDVATATGIGSATQNVWSRGYRRAYERRKRDGGGVAAEAMREGARVELVFRIQVLELARELVVEWVRGRDRILWESLCGVVHRHFKKS
ncbi:hypothetical protein T440DRAFT_226058 [Plenodomus tracheiphilus IPT5]|uniref:U6 small nuclear RNA (adenine-(43)-N(6))-methyltransferase n=1 Tax=Plenodomus tracheiphilus IPT5 TaxID=1408161 RepID=A0A6A7ATP7_9PLEO|nr:hypothetical protein T440DRAFT_226058 [Plenodomus tracheiphilus IPT5]